MAVSDIRIDVGFFSHRKTKRLVRLCGDAGVTGLLKLWIYSALNHADGDLSGLSDDEIEETADWTGAPGMLVLALRDRCHFLDGYTGSYTLHAWEEHQPWVASSPKRIARAKLGAAAKHEKWRSRNCDTMEDQQQQPSDNSACSAYSTDISASSRNKHNYKQGQAAESLLQAELSSAPSPSPSPSPSPKKTGSAGSVVYLVSGKHRISESYWRRLVRRMGGDEYRAKALVYRACQKAEDPIAWLEAGINDYAQLATSEEDTNGRAIVDRWFERCRGVAGVLNTALEGS